MYRLSLLSALALLLIWQTSFTSADPDDASNYTNADCRQVGSATDKCLFSKMADSCAIDEGFVNYIQVVFCNFSSVVPIGIIVFILWWLFLFLALAVTADDFFCPSLTVMSKVLRMSDNIAGVTLLAFGNGAPDIFSAIAAIGSMKSGSDAGLAFGALLGAGVFVTAVVSGAVIIAKPFQCMERPLLRDITFYIVALYYTFYIMYSRMITTLQAIGFLLLYVAYVIVVIVGRYIRKRKQNSSSQPTTPNTSTGDFSVNNSIVAKLEKDPDLATTFSKHLAEEAEHEERSRPSHHDHHSDQSSHSQSDLKDDSKPFDNSEDWDESTPLIDSRSIRIENKSNALHEFLNAINPISKEEWKEKKWYGKAYLVIKAPIQFILTITCPIVDYGAEKDNWNRHLSCFQVLLGPMFALFATNQYRVLIGGIFPLWALFLIICTLLSCIVLWLSNNHSPPKWHPFFAFLGFIVAVIWIYSIANEVVNILQLFGVVFQISNAILGLTLLAWGNSIGDFIADTALARKGYPRIGISACFGGPLFNLLLGVGIPFTIGCIKNGGSMALDFNFHLIVLTGGLLLSLLSTYILAPFVLKFFMRRWFGIYLIIVYVSFLLLAILTEVNVIKVDVSKW